MTTYKDWRGVPIEVGDTVVYHGPTSGNMVGIVDSFTAKGSVRFIVIYDNSHSGRPHGKKSVPPSRCTVVLALPPSDKITVPEKIARNNEIDLIEKHNWDSHTYPLEPKRLISFSDIGYDQYNKDRAAWLSGRCTTCSTSREDMKDLSCEQALCYL